MERVYGVRFQGARLPAALRGIAASGSIWSGPDPALSVGGKPEWKLHVCDGSIPGLLSKIPEL
jgi:bacillopeptidase F (M6 metalloprotease family)